MAEKALRRPGHGSRKSIYDGFFALDFLIYFLYQEVTSLPIF